MKVFNETVPWRLVIIGLTKALSCFRPQKKSIVLEISNYENKKKINIILQIYY